VHFSVNNGLLFSRKSIARVTSHKSTHMCTRVLLFQLLVLRSAYVIVGRLIFM